MVVVENAKFVLNIVRVPARVINPVDVPYAVVVLNAVVLLVDVLRLVPDNVLLLVSRWVS